MPHPRPRPLATALALLLLFLTALPAPAWWPAFTELGLGLQSHTDLDVQGGNLGGLGLRAHAAAPLLPGDSLDSPRLDLRLELAVNGFWNYASGAELALASGLRLYAPQLRPVSLAPFAEAGLGLTIDELRIHELGTRLNFLTFAGLGLRRPLSPSAFLDLGYRLRHISNGGLDERNHGLTSHMLGLEVAWKF